MPKFLTGARPTPRHKLAAARPFHAPPRLLAPPAKFGVVPSQLSIWGNATYGDCVTAEEAFAKAAYSVLLGLPEEFATDAAVVQWASEHGFLNGANLTDVMDAMAKSGLPINGTTYRDGPYQSVDWTNAATLQAALLQGPVKIGVASAQLQSVPGIGTANGWFATGFTQDANEDHCVALTGYGSVADCFALLNVPVPATVTNPAAPGYLLFTWSSIGVIDEPSMLAITGEAWLRTPTTVGLAPAPAPPSPPPPSPPVVPPPPAPPTGGNFTGVLTYDNGVLVSVGLTPPAPGMTLEDALNAALSDPRVVNAKGARYGASPIPAGTFIKLLAAVVPVIIADLAKGETFAEMVPDLVSALVLALS